MSLQFLVVDSKNRCSSEALANRHVSGTRRVALTMFSARSRAPSRLYPAASNAGNPQRQQFAAVPSNTFNNVSPAKMKMLKPRPPVHPAPERPVSAPHSPPSGQANGDAAGGTVAPFSDPPGSTKIPSVHTQMRMHMRLNAGEAMGGGAPDRFNSQPPPKVTTIRLSMFLSISHMRHRYNAAAFQC
jgi:hypothetical protein